MTRKSRISAYLSKHGPSYSSQVARSLDLKPKEVGGTLACMEQDGLVSSHKTGIRAAKLWRLA